MAILTHSFFGEDFGIGEGTRLSSHPNSDAARAEFLTYLTNSTGNGVEDFESFPDDTLVPLTLPSYTGLGTVILTDAFFSGFVNEIPTGTNGAGRYPISGDKYFNYRAVDTITLDLPVLAIGFYSTDLGDFGATMVLKLYFQAGGDLEVAIPATIPQTGGGVCYFACIASEPVSSFEIRNTTVGEDVFGLDDLLLADADHVTAAGKLLVGIEPPAAVSLADPGPFIPDFDPCTSRPPRRGERWEVCSRCGFCYPQSEVVVQQGTGGGVIVCVRFCLDEPSRRDLRPDELTVEAPLSFVDDEGPMV